MTKSNMAMLEVTNLSQLLERAASFETGVTIYGPGDIQKNSRMSYKELFQDAKQKARFLHRSKLIAQGTIILLHFDNHADAIEWLWATIVAGYLPAISTPLPNDHGQRRKHLLHLHANLNNPIVLTSRRLIPEFLGIEQIQVVSTDNIQDHFSTNVAEGLSYRTWYSWWLSKLPNFYGQIKPVEENDTRSLCGYQAHPGDLAILMLTSGSTGFAKAVGLRHEQILKAVEGKSRHHETTQRTNFFNWIGIDHVANLTEIQIHAMYLGANQVHVHAADLLVNPLLFLTLLSKHKVEYTFAPNFFLASLRKLLDGQESLTSGAEDPLLGSNIDLSNLKAFISGGEANVVETCDALTRSLRRFNVQGDVLRPGFGMTETCAGSIYGKSCPSYELALDLEFASLGTCIPGMQMRVMSDDGSATAQNEAGNLQVQGDVVFRKYYNNEAATADAFTDDGWFITGDRALVDAAGNLHLAGRAKESIIINGISVYPHQLESAIKDARLPGLTPSFTAVFSYRSRGFDTERFCVVYHPAYAPNDIAICVETADAIATVSALTFGARPHQIIPLGKPYLPKTTLGKLSRSKIKKAFELGTYQELQAGNLDAIRSYKSQKRQNRHLTSIEEIVFLSFVEILDLDPDDIGIDSSVFEAGITSIDLLRLKTMLQNKLGVAQIPLILILTNPSAEGMSKALERLARGEDGDHLGEYNPVVALGTKGLKTPLWLVHPGVGEVLVFLNLAKYITDRPVYALRASGFEQSEDILNSIPQIVKTYSEHIKRTQPNGPYAIAGYSFGAMLAFEISKHLEAQGDEIRFLGSFNLPPHIKTRMKELDWTEVALNLGCFLGFYAEEHQHHVSLSMHHHQQSRADVLTHIMQQAAPSRVQELSLTRGKLERWISLAHAMQAAARDYDPSGTVASIDIFYCTPLASVACDRAVWLREHLSKWKDFSRSVPHFHEVQGAHYTMLDPQNVFTFQKRLQCALGERGV